jgi:hypothetical protein
MEETSVDHLCLMNDDLHVEGDFVKFYAEAHADTGVELFCNMTFTSEMYKPALFKIQAANGKEYTLKLLPRMTGIMMSMTRKLVEKIGYYDTSFGPFGEEHTDYTHRARFSGGININGQQLHCLDVEQPTPMLLRHQDVPTSLSGDERRVADATAAGAMQRASKEYSIRDWYRPFSLVHPSFCGAYEGVGINVGKLRGYAMVVE